MIKKIAIILAVISIIIIILGLMVAKNTKNELITQTTTSGNMYIDGTDMTSVSDAFTQIGSGLLGIVIIIYSFLLVGAIWGIFGIIILIITIIKKLENKKNNKDDK
jgi:hypothetical protein